MSELLKVHNLTVEYVTDDGTVHAVNDLSLSVESGKIVGLVGETGAGKTTLAKAIMQLLPSLQARVPSGEVFFEGTNLMDLSPKKMRKIRGDKIAMIFQDPMTSLNPVLTVGDQIRETIRLHKKCSRAESYRLAKEMLEKVGIKPDRIDEYPHQFSGGMKQRVGIAMALACSPQLLIADEPTSALDVTIQAQVIALMKELMKQYNAAMIMITHDLGIVAETCDYVAVMYAGQIVEYGSKYQIFTQPLHPYTKGLFECIPDLTREQEELIPIPGLMADPTVVVPGCSFAPRCKYATSRCHEEKPELCEISSDHQARCFLCEGRK